MKIDEKAKAYDEMVQRVKELHETGNFLTKKQMEIICPELAESEGERIRKEIINFFECQKRDEPTREDILNKWISYLEKQKELDKMIVVSPEVWDNAISDAFENGKKEGEKQKENPKSSDSIPPDDVSDAKCENRWHKVTDSLPDNGREVLAKDKLGNTLLARYDGEGWDVSVYDDEDYRCHNGISKWREIPSEKQNEQKPDELDGKALLHVSNKSYDIGFREPAEWSDEDDQLIGFIFDLLNSLVWRKEWAMDKKECLERLKSLRPSWKPSEEQIKALKDAADRDFFEGIGATLRELYRDIKKLM